ncbi:hypothetical protein D3C71_1499080 [compost metagenome]
MIPRQIVGMFANGRHGSRGVIGTEGARPLPEHFGNNSHADGGGDFLVVGRPVLADNRPPLGLGLPMHTRGRIEILPRLGGHHQRSFTADDFEQSPDQSLRSAHYITKLA